MEFEISAADPDELKYQVQHCCIDLHAMDLVEKVQWIQKGKQLEKFKTQTLQDVMMMINLKFSDEIMEHVVLQKIIDS